MSVKCRLFSPGSGPAHVALQSKIQPHVQASCVLLFWTLLINSGLLCITLILQGVEIDYKGPCGAPCPAGPAVCGIDGVTYKSECHAARAEVQVGLHQACPAIPPGELSGFRVSIQLAKEQHM